MSLDRTGTLRWETGGTRNVFHVYFVRFTFLCGVTAALLSDRAGWRISETSVSCQADFIMAFIRD